MPPPERATARHGDTMIAPSSENSQVYALPRGRGELPHAIWSIRVPWPGGRAARGGGVRVSSRSNMTSGGLTSGGFSTLASGGFRGIVELTAEISIGQHPRL